jgi:hypothetical protein
LAGGEDGKSAMRLGGPTAFLVAVFSSALFGQRIDWSGSEFQPDTFQWTAIVDAEQVRGRVSCELRDSGTVELELLPEPATTSRWIVVLNTRQRVQTDDHGHFHFGVVDPGRYKLLIRHSCTDNQLPKDEEVLVFARPSFDDHPGDLVIKLQGGKVPWVGHKRAERNF